MVTTMMTTESSEDMTMVRTMTISMGERKSDNTLYNDAYCVGLKYRSHLLQIKYLPSILDDIESGAIEEGIEQMSPGRRNIRQLLKALKHFLRLGKVLEGEAQSLEVFATDHDVEIRHRHRSRKTGRKRRKRKTGKE